MGQINKGTIAVINGDTARVVPYDTSTSPTAKVLIPQHLRGEAGNLKKGTEVVYIEFEDFTGLLLSRADGEGGGGGTVQIELDTTLTKEGMAAEAKAVGTRLSNLSVSYPLEAGAAELQPDRYYVFGKVSELSLTLAEVDDGKVHEYCFEFIPTGAFTELNITPEVKWATPCVFTAGDVHQVSILRSVGVMIRA